MGGRAEQNHQAAGFRRNIADWFLCRLAECALSILVNRPFALYCHNTAGALPVRVSLWIIPNRPTQSRTDAASSAMNDATRTIEIGGISFVD